MKYEIEIMESFEKKAKTLLKKYPSLKRELAELGASLSENPFQGNRLSENCFKIRIAIKSKSSLKSGGGRIITHVMVVRRKVLMLSIYDKAEKETITIVELKELIKKYNL
jgi:mRNA-degrading endonuclease RelE of RelBE toxin-antitoxin system